MRGYRRLKRDGRIGSIAALKQELTVHRLNINEKYFSPAIMGAGLSSGELIIRQYLLVRLGGNVLNKCLLAVAGKTNSKIVCALPPEWFDIAEKHGFKVARLRSTLLFLLYAFALFLYGVITTVKIVFAFKLNGVAALDKKTAYAYFSDLAPNNIPRNKYHEGGRNVVSWYIKWAGKSSDINSIRHSVIGVGMKEISGFKLAYQSGPVPSFLKVTELCKYFVIMTMIVGRAVFDFFQGKWWHALLLNQIALAVQARIISPALLAKEYYFHNSNWIYRPLWTYEAEKVGSIINFYFYSTNTQSFNKECKCMPAPYGWNASTWPCYLVWDEYQEQFVHKMSEGKNVKIVNEIWFSDDEGALLNIPDSLKIAVFDVQPFRSSKYQTLGLDYEYYVPEVAIAFLNDIQEVLEEFGVGMLFKRKRDIGKVAHPIYLSSVKLIERKSNVISVDPSISASRVIEKSLAVISMPFTSTALLAINQSKHSVYYDPFSRVIRDDCAAHGVQVLIGKEELREWVKNIIVQ